MVHSISILGSTGSIGRQTVAVAEHLGLNVRALTTNRNIQLADECKEEGWKMVWGNRT